MTKYQFDLPHFRIFGYLIWAVLLIFSILFYQERVLFLDGGFQVFKMVNEGIPQVYHYRFSTLFIQILPYSAFLLGASIKWIMILYSASYILFFGLTYHLIVKWLRNDYLGWALIFLFTLITLDSFYFIQSEYYLALALLLLTFGIINRFPDLKERWLFPVFVLLLLTIVLSHKLTLIPFTFLWIFFWLQNERLRHKRYYLLFGLFLGLFLFKSQFFTNWYETSKSQVFSDNLSRFFPNYFDIPANNLFLERAIDHYYFIPILWIGLSIFYLKKVFTSNLKFSLKANSSTISLLKFLLIGSFVVGQVLLYAIADPDAPYRFYAELNYLPILIFLGVPLLFELGNKANKIVFSVFAIVLFTRLFIIADNHTTYEKRISWMETQLEKTEKLGTNRLQMLQKDAPMDLIIQDWGVPYNTLLLSTLESPDSAKTLFIHENFDSYKRKDLLQRDDYFLTRFHNQALQVDSMNLDYFRLRKGQYKMIE
jgi:hypothetical protein